MPVGKNRGKGDSLVPFDRAQLRAAIDRDGRSRRAIAKALVRRLPGRAVFKSQTLNAMCNSGRTCRASVRRALAEELELPEIFLVQQLQLPAGAASRQARVFIEWSRLVLSLKIWERSAEAHAALLDLPDTFGLAMIHLWERGAPLAALDPPKPGPEWFIRAGVEHQAAWNEWLRKWIEAEGKDAVREAVIERGDLIRARFVGAERYWKPKRARTRRLG